MQRYGDRKRKDPAHSSRIADRQNGTGTVVLANLTSTGIGEEISETGFPAGPPSILIFTRGSMGARLVRRMESVHKNPRPTMMSMYGNR
jgi:hypothetical protein